MQLNEILNPYTTREIQEIISIVTNINPSDMNKVKEIFASTPYFDSINRERYTMELTDLDFFRPDLLTDKLSVATNFGHDKNSRYGSGDEKYPTRLLRKLKQELGE